MAELTQSKHYDYVPIIDREPFKLPNGARTGRLSHGVLRVVAAAAVVVVEEVALASGLK